MKLILDNREIDCVSRWCDTPQGEGVFWRFIADGGRVWRVHMMDLPGTRTLGSIDNAVTVKSLLFPVADFIRCVGKYDGTGSKKEIVRLFLTNLLMQFDSDFASIGAECGRIHSDELLPNVPNARRRKIGLGRSIPDEILEAVLEMVLRTDANPNIGQCSGFLNDIEEVLRDGKLVPQKYNWGDLAFVVKRLATRFTCFAPLNLKRHSIIENKLLNQYRLFTGKENSPEKIQAGDKGFLAFLKCFSCVALYTVMKDTRVLPVYKFDPEPQEMNAEELKTHGARGNATPTIGMERPPQIMGGNGHLAKPSANSKPKRPRKRIADGKGYSVNLVNWLNDTRPGWVEKQRKAHGAITWPAFKRVFASELQAKNWHNLSPDYLKGAYDTGKNRRMRND